MACDFGDVYAQPVRHHQYRVKLRGRHGKSRSSLAPSSGAGKTALEALPKLRLARPVTVSVETSPVVARNLALCSRAPPVVRLPAINQSGSPGSARPALCQSRSPGSERADDSEAGATSRQAALSPTPRQASRQVPSSPSRGSSRQAPSSPSQGASKQSPLPPATPPPPPSSPPPWAGGGGSRFAWISARGLVGPAILRDDCEFGVALAEEVERCQAVRRRELGLKAHAETRESARQWEQRRRRLEEKKIREEGECAGRASQVQASNYQTLDTTDGEAEEAAMVAKKTMRMKRLKVCMKKAKTAMRGNAMAHFEFPGDQEALIALQEYKQMRCISSMKRGNKASEVGPKHNVDGLPEMLRLLGLGGCCTHARREVQSSLEAIIEELQSWEVDDSTIGAVIAPHVRGVLLELEAPRAERIFRDFAAAFGRENVLTEAETMAALDFYLSECTLSSHHEDIEELLELARTRMEELIGRASPEKTLLLGSAAAAAAAAQCPTPSSRAGGQPTLSGVQARHRTLSVEGEEAVAVERTLTCPEDAFRDLAQHVHEKAHTFAGTRARLVSHQVQALKSSRSDSELLTLGRYLWTHTEMDVDGRYEVPWEALGEFPLCPDVKALSTIEIIFRDSVREILELPVSPHDSDSQDDFAQPRTSISQDVPSEAVPQARRVEVQGELSKFDEFVHTVDRFRKLAREHVERCLADAPPTYTTGHVLTALGISPSSNVEREAVLEVLEQFGVHQAQMSLEPSAMADCAVQAMERLLRCRRDGEQRLASALGLEAMLPAFRQAFAATALGPLGRTIDGNKGSAGIGGGRGQPDATARRMASEMGGQFNRDQSVAASLGDGLTISLKPGLQSVLAATGAWTQVGEDAALKFLAAATEPEPEAEDGMSPTAAGPAPSQIDFTSALLALGVALESKQESSATFVDERSPLKRVAVLRLVLGAMGMHGPFVQALSRRDQEALAKKGLQDEGAGARDLAAEFVLPDSPKTPRAPPHAAPPTPSSAAAAAAVAKGPRVEAAVLVGRARRWALALAERMAAAEPRRLSSDARW